MSLPAAAFDSLAALLRERSGLTIGPDKTYLLETRLGPIAKRENLPDLAALAARLRAPGAEGLTREVVEAMTTNESLFFRDSKPFAHVRAVALPRLHAARPPGVKLRIWSAAASTGQEAYSLAMIAAELRPAMPDRRIEILGTDLGLEAHPVVGGDDTPVLRRHRARTLADLLVVGLVPPRQGIGKVVATTVMVPLDDAGEGLRGNDDLGLGIVAEPLFATIQIDVEGREGRSFTHPIQSRLQGQQGVIDRPAQMGQVDAAKESMPIGIVGLSGVQGSAHDRTLTPPG